MIQTLSNDLLDVKIESQGAELQSIESKRSHHQYLWQGDARFWGRRSPVLFPIVGAVWNGVFHMDGQEYPMGQHGFARDMEFTPVEGGADDEAWFALDWNDETLKRFPRRFRLEIGYKLHEARISVMWRVTNLDTETMHFQIGAHPAFNYPDFNAADAVHAYLDLDGRDLTSEVIGEKGCISEETIPVSREADGLLSVGNDTFVRDAIIITGSKVRRVSMLTKEQTPYLSLLFSSPAVGIWSPSSQAPFMCIEPWWGRADRMGFEGEFKARDYVNSLEPGAVFNASYMIIIDNI